MDKLKKGFFFLGILSSINCFSQDVPLGTMPMYFNGSFAGEAEFPRLSSNIVFENSKGSGENFTVFTSYDQFISAIGSGVGIHARHTNNTDFIEYSLSSIGAVIAPKFSLKGKVTVSPSIDFQYNSLNYTLFHKDFFLIRAGLLLNTSRFYIGYSLNLTNRFYNESKMYQFGTLHSQILDHTVFYNLKGLISILQTGYTFQRSQESLFAFTPQILFFLENYKGYPLLSGVVKFMLNFKYDEVLWGVSDEGLHVGWQKNQFRIIAFNDLSLNLFNPIVYQNKSNLSLRYVFN